MFIYIKMDTESNETAPAIAFLRFHRDSEMFTKKQHQKVSVSTQIVELEKKQGQIWNQRPLKRWRPLWTLPFFLVSHVIKTTKRDFPTTMLVTPHDSPFRAAQTQPGRRVFRNIRGTSENRRNVTVLQQSR